MSSAFLWAAAAAFGAAILVLLWIMWRTRDQWW